MNRICEVVLPAIDFFFVAIFLNFCLKLFNPVCLFALLLVDCVDSLRMILFFVIIPRVHHLVRVHLY